MNVNLVEKIAYFVNTSTTVLVMFLVYILIRRWGKQDTILTDFGGEMYKFILISTGILLFIYTICGILLPRKKMKRNDTIAFISLLFAITIFELFGLY
jgi:hypothetical protein